MEKLQNLKDLKALRISLASPKEILSWSHGEILKPETINYRTFRSEKDGLFCEKIFGPTKDFECYCGKYRRIRYKGVICDKCGVEVTYSRVRRERMGHIQLAVPCAHVWFLRGIPSKMGILLDISPRVLEAIVYFSSFIVTGFDGSKRAKVLSSLEKELRDRKDALAKETDLQINQLEKEAEREAKAVKLADKARKELAQEEIRLKAKKQMAKLRDGLVVEQEKLEKEYEKIEKKLESVQFHMAMTDGEYLQLAEWLDQFAKVGIGAEAILKILRELDLDKLAKQLRQQIETAQGQKLLKLTKRLRVVEGFRRAGVRPEWMISTIVPVIPPDLRPMVQLEGGRFATSDLNDLYRRVINRNNRLRKLLELGAPEIIVQNEKRMLQEAVDALIDSSRWRGARPRRGHKQLRSLSDMLKGKQGRFRQNLLGKRVDYSGRSVIVVGPELSLGQCGLPKEMALELFKPFVLKEILQRGLAPNVKSAKYVLESRVPEVWDVLEQVVHNYPILLNRAPTLHRLGIQAFYPQLIDGSALRLHPCVCDGFNADFDGDQMAVHIPLSADARREASEIMLSTQNLLKPADARPISVPTKDMLLGTYYLTSFDGTLSPSEVVFADPDEALLAFNLGRVKLRQPIRVEIGGQLVETSPGRLILNEHLPSEFGFFNEVLEKESVKGLVGRALKELGWAETVELIDNLKGLGFKYGTVSGFSLSMADCRIPPQKGAVLDEAGQEVAKIDRNFKRGLITKAESSRLTQAVWLKATSQLDDLSWNLLGEQNPIRMIVSSGGGRASREQVKQISGMRGLVADPTGQVVDLPIKSNYHEGLTGFEYFAGTRGARKGLTDKALKTADAGYLTRRLVDVAQNILVREEDCGTKEGRVVYAGDATLLASFADQIVGRVAAQTVKKGRTVLVKAGGLIDREKAQLIEESGLTKVTIRSPLTCRTRYGICSKCYGLDLAKLKMVKEGTPVGIAAAQSIGEPGTQLTMRTFHLGGVVGRDITQGLPRVEEILEARTPKGLSVMSDIAGKVEIVEREGKGLVIVRAVEKGAEPAVAEYEVDPVAEILVGSGDLVAPGDPLTGGYLDLGRLLETVGIGETQRYIINEIQKVYASQGVSLNDKHLEVIVKQMFSRIKVVDPGVTDFLTGELIDRQEFEETNTKTSRQKAVGEVVLLGITRASLETDSFLAAASFMETTRVLTEAAISGRVDPLRGLKENVILGRLIPVGERMPNPSA